MKETIPLLANCILAAEHFPARIVASYELETGEKCKDYLMYPLFTIHGLAPTYYSPSLGGKYANVKMHWFRGRTHPLRINYNEVFGREKYKLESVQAVNQMFLAEEAQIFKVWMDAIYPEEETTIYRVVYPIERELPMIPIGQYAKGEGGSFTSFDYRWTHDWIIRYWVDVTKCDLVGVDP